MRLFSHSCHFRCATITTNCNFSNTICRRSENLHWQKCYSQRIFGLCWQKSQKLLLLPTQVKLRWQKMWKSHWLQQKFPPKERESLTNACFSNVDVIMRWQLFCLLATHMCALGKLRVFIHTIANAWVASAKPHLWQTYLFRYYFLTQWKFTSAKVTENCYFYRRK